jgi:hypothetical protein
MSAMHRSSSSSSSSSSKIERSQAENILRDVPQDKAFHFYLDIGKPTGVFARNLKELAAGINSVDIRSIEFHVLRGDFEKWLSMLGDQYLAHQFGRLRDLRLKDESLRSRAAELVTNRWKALSQSVGS